MIFAALAPGGTIVLTTVFAFALTATGAGENGRHSVGTTVFGGMIMARAQLGVGFTEFLDRFVKAVSITAYMVGIGKAPVELLHRGDPRPRHAEAARDRIDAREVPGPVGRAQRIEVEGVDEDAGGHEGQARPQFIRAREEDGR